jgi:hypothetical protein
MALSAAAIIAERVEIGVMCVEAVPFSRIGESKMVGERRTKSG